MDGKTELEREFQMRMMQLMMGQVYGNPPANFHTGPPSVPFGGMHNSSLSSLCIHSQQKKTIKLYATYYYKRGSMTIYVIIIMQCDIRVIVYWIHTYVKINVLQNKCMCED